MRDGRALGCELQDVLLDLWQSTGTAALMVTHDIGEALYLSDRIALMTNGPGAIIGDDIDVPFERPRDRRALADRVEYHALRQRVLDFLDDNAQRRRRPPRLAM